MSKTARQIISAILIILNLISLFYIFPKTPAAYAATENTVDEINTENTPEGTPPGDLDMSADSDAQGDTQNPPSGGDAQGGTQNPPSGGDAQDGTQNPPSGGDAQDDTQNPPSGGDAQDGTQNPPPHDADGLMSTDLGLMGASGRAIGDNVSITFYTKVPKAEGAISNLKDSYLIKSAVGELISPLDNSTMVITNNTHSFKGWYTAAAPNGVKWNFASDRVQGDMSLYAHWEDIRNRQSLTVNFYNGGTRYDPVGHPITLIQYGGSKEISPDSSAATNYTGPGGSGSVSFAGWYETSDFSGSAFSSSKAFYVSYTSQTPRTLNLYARYRRSVYFRYSNKTTVYSYDSLSFYTDSTSGSYTPPDLTGTKNFTTVIDGITVSKPYKHEGGNTWYTDAACTIPFAGSVDGTISSLSSYTYYNGVPFVYLYAKFVEDTSIPNCTVTLNYKTDAAGNGIEDAQKIITVPQGTSISVLPIYNVGNGVVFKGWYYEEGSRLYTSESGSNITISPNITVNSNITLTAQYSCVISFSTNHSGYVSLNGTSIRSVPDVIVDYGGTMSYPGTPEAPPYEFQGWFWLGSAMSGEFDPDVPIVSSGDLNAVFNSPPPEDVWEISYDVNGGTPAANFVQLVRKGSTFTCAHNASRQGYILDGWYYNGRKWDFTTDTAQSDMTLVAEWLKTYNVNFIIENTPAITIGIQDLFESMHIVKPEDPVVSDAEFLGWAYKTADSNYVLWNFDDPLTYDIAGDNAEFNLYARYLPYPTVHLDYNNGTGFEQDILANIMQEGHCYFVFPPKPDIYGKDFAGWYEYTIDPNDGSKIISTTRYDDESDYSARVRVDSDILLIAQWVDSEITITFDSNKTQAELTENIKTELGSMGDRVRVPVFDKIDNGGGGYDMIVSWHTDQSCTTTPVNFNEYIVSGEDVTFYGKWGPEVSLTVRGTVKGRQAFLFENDFAYGSLIDKSNLVSPSSDWFTFQNEWYFGDVLWDFSYPLAFELELEAVVGHKVTYDFNGGSGPVNSTDVYYNSGLYAPPSPSRAGAVFSGWYTSLSGGNRWKFIGEDAYDHVTEHMTLYAQWNTNRPPVLERIGDLSQFCGQTLTVDFNATDPDGDPLTYTVTMSDGTYDLAVDVIERGTDSKSVIFTPRLIDAGNIYTLKVTVTDGSLSDTQIFTLRAVLPGNKIPLTFNQITADDKVYDATDSATVTATFFGVLPNYPLTEGVDYIISGRFADVNADDDVNVFVTLTLLNTAMADIYSAPADEIVTADIFKAPGLTAAPVDVIEADRNEPELISLNLDQIILNKSDLGNYKYFAVDYVDKDSGIITDLALNGYILEFNIDTTENNACSAEIVVLLSTQNYLDVEIRIPVELPAMVRRFYYVQDEAPAEEEPPEAYSEAPYLNGYEDGTLRPNATLTREQAAQILFNLYGDSDTDLNVLRGFIDGDLQSWSSEALAWAVSKGYLIGYSDSYLRAGNAITRGELAALLYRAAEDIYGLTPVQSGMESGHWADEYIDGLVNSGILEGSESSLSLRDSTLTRAQAVDIISEFAARSSSFSNARQFEDLPVSFWAYSCMMNAANGC